MLDFVSFNMAVALLIGGALVPLKFSLLPCDCKNRIQIDLRDYFEVR
jgi:hypothetical protein